MLFSKALITVFVLAPASSLAFVNYTSTYTAVCHDLLDKLSCPNSVRKVYSGHRLSTFDPVCSCGSFDGSGRVAELVNDNIVFNGTGSVKWAFVNNTAAVGVNYNGSAILDVTKTYKTICSFLLTSINCSKKDSKLSTLKKHPSGKNDSTSIYKDWAGVCVCGGLDMSDREYELMIDAEIKADITGIRVQ